MGRPLGPPCAYEHPLRGCSYQPPSGVGKRQLFLFVSHGQPSASRLVYQPLRVGTGPLRSGNATFNARTRVRNNFGHFSRDLGQNCRLVFFFDRHPSGPLDPFGAHPSGVINQPPTGLVKENKIILFEAKNGGF